MSTSTIVVSSVEASDVIYPAPESAVADPRDEFGLIAEAVLADHAELVRAAARLRVMCTALEGTSDPVDAEPARLLEEFENELLPHFAAEELEECCGSLITEEPRLLGQLGRLQSEHTEIANALDELLEFARAKPPGGELATRLNRFLLRFEAHERAENALMQELVLLDEGTSGE